MRYENEKPTEKTYFSIYIDKDLDEKVRTYANEHKWSRSFAINEILAQFLSIKE